MLHKVMLACLLILWKKKIWEKVSSFLAFLLAMTFSMVIGAQNSHFSNEWIIKNQTVQQDFANV